jgi:hypothetical protein
MWLGSGQTDRQSEKKTKRQTDKHRHKDTKTNKKRTLGGPEALRRHIVECPKLHGRHEFRRWSVQNLQVHTH